MKIVIHIRRYRELRGMTLQELARKTGISKSAIAAIETGVHSPSILTLCKLARGLGVSPKELFSYEDKVTRESMEDTL